MSECAAVQHSSLMVCERCDLQWDTNDPDPPKCRPRSVCYPCPKLRAAELTPGGDMLVFYCEHNGAVVPHRAASKTQRVTFTRVPEFCPLSDAETVKSARPATHAEHYTLIFEAVRHRMPVKGYGDE